MPLNAIAIRVARTMPTTISTAPVPVALKKNAAPTKIARIT